MKGSEPWLSIIGVGADGWNGLNEEVRTVALKADIVIASKRQLRLLPNSLAQRGEVWEESFSILLERLKDVRLENVNACIFASGDPMWHGLGASLTLHLKFGEYRVFPAISSRSLAAARLGWALQGTISLSLHNRPASILHPHLAPRARLLLLSRNADTPGTIAKLLCEQGYGGSNLWILEQLGGPQERIRKTRADSFNIPNIANLNLVAVEVCSRCTKDRIGIFGLADESFAHDGNITRREIRAIALARLASYAGAVLWDVGAGSGSLSVEWMRLHPNNRAVAFEIRKDRCCLIKKNREKFGVPELEIREQPAPRSFAGLPPPDAIFFGGGIASTGLLEAGWQALEAGGHLVAHAVSVEGEAALLKFRQQKGGEMLRVNWERLESLGSMEGWRPARAIVMLEARR